MQNTYPTTPDFNNITNLSSLQTAALQSPRPPRPPARKSSSATQATRPASGLSHAPAQNINKASFASNAQIPSLTHTGLLSQPRLPVGLPARTPQSIPEQTIPHNTLPGLSFPPESVSLSQSQKAQSRPPSQSTVSVLQGLDGNADTHQYSSEVSNVQAQAGKVTQGAGRVTPEEGELSDGELQEDFPPPTTSIQSQQGHSHGTIPLSDTPMSNEQNTPQRHERSAANPMSHNLLGSYGVDANVTGDYSVTSVPVVSEDEGSLSSYNPPSASTPEHAIEPESFIEPSNYTQTAHSIKPVANINSKDYRSGGKKPPEVYQGKSIRQWRYLAQEAVLSLVPHNIRYEDLVKEGVNGSLLQSLYQEATFKITPNSNSVTPIMSNVSASTAKPAKSIQTGTALNGPSASTETEASGKRKEGDASSAGANPVLQPPISAQQSTPKPISTTPLNQTKEPPTSAVPPISRKDLIAQRLAARNGKTILNQSPETVPVPTTLSKPISSPEAGLDPVTPNAKPVVTDSRQKSVSPPPAQSRPTSASKAKSKAQTDLVRQKMELLKKQAPAKLVSQQTQQNSRSVPLVQTTTVSLPSYSSSDARVSEVLTPTAPSALRAEISPSSQIPGLFLADAGLDELISSAKQQVWMQETSPTVSHDPTATVQTKNSQVEPHIINIESPQQRSNSPDTIGKSSTKGHASIRNDGTGISPSTAPRDRQPLKRPIASDSFDDPQPSRKRPFGRKESYDNVEIVISDNEEDERSEDVDMELDEESEETSRSGHFTISEFASYPVPTGGTAKISAVQQPQSRQSMYQSSSSAQTPSKEKEDLFKAKSLEEADMKIADMKRRIAEAEARRNAKRTISLSQTPKSSPPTTPMNCAAAEAETPIQTTLNPPNTTSATAAVGDAARAEALRQKLLRRRQAQTSSLATDDEVEKSRSLLAQSQAKLAEMREELRKREAAMQEETERLEASIRRNLAERAKLAGELEQLGADVGSIPIHQISTKELEAEKDQFVEQQAREALSPQNNSVITESRTLGSDDTKSPPANSPQQLVHEEFGECGPEPSSANISESTIERKLSTESGFETNAPGPYAAITSTAEDSSPGGVAIPIGGSPGSAFNDTQESDGSISMSDGDSDTYEPMEPAADNLHVDSDIYEPTDLAAAEIQTNSNVPSMTTESRAQSEDDEAMSIDDDPYEPAEVQHTQHSTFESSQAPDLAAKTNGTNRIETSQPLVSQKAAADDIEDTRPLIDPAKIASDGIPAPTLTANPEQQPNQSQTPTTREPALECLTGPVPFHTEFRYHPYDSPFTKFRNFRFNERFLDTIPGGYRSITYSGRVDPKKLLCATELAGETCTDPKCPDQHFNDMLLTDDKILVEMSSAKDFKDKEERDRFVAGLKQVIADLRSRGVKEFTMVANELAAYRRRFQQSQLGEVLL